MPEIVFDQFGNRQLVELSPEQLAADKAIADAYDNSVTGIANRLKSEFGKAVDLSAPLLADLPKESRRRHNALINEFLGASQRGDVDIALDILFTEIVPADKVEMEAFTKIAKFFEKLPEILERLEAAKALLVPEVKE